MFDYDYSPYAYPLVSGYWNWDHSPVVQQIALEHGPFSSMITRLNMVIVHTYAVIIGMLSFSTP
jgi:hypothetical protein